MAKKVKKLVAPKPLQNVRFDSSLIMILLAALILLISFLIYSNSNMKTPTETIEEEDFFGSDCTVDLDCPQPRCPGMKGLCENGYCRIEQISPSATRCIDLQTTLCGNSICEAEEKETCPEDCGEEDIEICVSNGKCEISLTEMGYSENENILNCPEDCFCGDAVCDDEEDNIICPEDC